MADILREVSGLFSKRWRDMGDGSHAEVVALGGTIPAGAAIIGRVGIDQTTPGTTNGVQVVNPRSTATATIALNASLSDAIDLGSNILVGIQMPAAWTAASLSFQASAAGSTYGTFKDRYGTEYTLTVAASEFLALPAADFAAVRYIKLRSGTAASPVNQLAARSITLITRPM